MKPRRVLIMAGGTGGHVFPALAVAEELRARGVVVNWLGTRRGIEADLVPGADFPLHFIDVVGLRGKSGVIVKLKAPWGLLKALWQAMGVVRRVGPQCVLGFGGFASGPGGLAARLLNKPLVIHARRLNAVVRWVRRNANVLTYTPFDHTHTLICSASRTRLSRRRTRRPQR